MQAWQAFLAARYGSIVVLNLTYGTVYAGFGDVPLPSDLPAGGQRLADWGAWTLGGDVAAPHAGWQDFLRRRYGSIAALDQAHGAHWPDFALVAPPHTLPLDGKPLLDWFQYEAIVLATRRNAHRFTVLLPAPQVTPDREPAAEQQRLELARRILDLEKPAHTIYDVKFYWALFRLGEARLGEDTLLDQGSRATQFL